MGEPMDPLVWAAMCIVNHIFDMAGVTVDVRQRVNDEADAYVLMKLREVVGGNSGCDSDGERA